jgi:hypothetical protein
MPPVSGRSASPVFRAEYPREPCMNRESRKMVATKTPVSKKATSLAPATVATRKIPLRTSG